MPSPFGFLSKPYTRTSLPLGAQIVYVPCGTGAVYMYSIDPSTGALIPLSTSTLSVSGAAYVALPLSGFHAYIGSSSTDIITICSINPNTGVLTVIGTQTIGSSVSYIARHPTGNWFYVSSITGNTIYMFSVDPSTGALTPLSTPTISGGGSVGDLVITPNGEYLYAANYSTNTVSQYSINQTTGILSALSPATVTVGSQPQAMYIDSTNSYFYVPCAGSSLIYECTIGSGTGLLTVAHSYSLNTVRGCLMNSSETFLYGAAVSNIEVYSVSNGALTAVSSSPATGAYNGAIAIDGTGSWLYSTEHGTDIINQFSINSSTGALSSLVTKTTGTGPSNIVIFTLSDLY